MIIGLVLVFIFLHMCFIWLWYRHTNNPSVVDVGWASGLTLSGLIYLNNSGWSLRSCVIGLPLIIWGLRLGGYLWYTRIRQRIVDKRYTKLSENWKIAKPLGFFLNFQLQGVLIFIISLPWYFSSFESDATISFLDIFGLLIFTIAIILEAVADNQLNRFKESFPGRVCDQKLWSYCRHPNYFFEWLILCAFCLFALPHPYGWVSVISPLTLYFLMTRITAPLTEKASVQSKGEAYIHYQRVTPMFFPKLQRKE